MLGIVYEYDDLNHTIDDPVQGAVECFNSHPSILKIKENVVDGQNFSFRQVTANEIQEQIINLNPKKAAPQSTIPAKISFDNIDLFIHPLKSIFNSYVNDS